ncbi:MAG: carbohydrate ABC transporter permease [Oscillospiraceae bacterium]|nr:carbohydrate ABC transporter permease [Oscillospiraceae bacterium]
MKKKTALPVQETPVTPAPAASERAQVPDSAIPVVHEEHVIGDGMSKKEAMQKRMQNMTRSEINALRRKQAMEACWPVFRFLILFGLGFVILTPLLFMISYGFRDNADMHDPTIIWIPRHLTLRIMKETMKAMGMMQSKNNPIINTLVLNVGCSICQVITCAITGYGFARFQFKGKKLLFGIVILMILVPTQIISIPLNSTFRHFLFDHFNLIDSMLAMYLPALTANGIRSGLMIFIFRQFFRGLPKELEDAAYLDGCGPFGTFWKVMIPNAGSSFLTVFLFSIVWYWNDYYVASAFFTNLKTISLVLKNLDGTLNLSIFNNANANISAREKIVWLEAGCLISITPLLILYTCLQKYFTEGIERSGLVG